LDLLYLAWGRRQYGRHQIPVSRHPGWHYVLVNRGKPTLVFENRRKVLGPGEFLVIDPDCASGWADQLDGQSELLVWIWRTGPRCSECSTAPASYRQWTIGTRLWRKLEQFHDLCRHEVEQPDEYTNLAIKQLHLAIDITVARLVRNKAQPPEPSVRMELALRWMAQNIAEQNLTESLCEYLQISRTALSRMFQTQYGVSPSVLHHRLRMAKAHEMLKTEHSSVEAIASSLGFKHLDDFSRALKRFGKSPVEISRILNSRSLKES
jgi:AraC-like DNA-binding protein